MSTKSGNFIYIPDYDNSASFQQTAPADGSTTNTSDSVTNVTIIILAPGTPILTATCTLPPTPFDGQKVTITGASNAITTLTLAAGGGRALASPFVATLAVGGFVSYIYNATATTWYRIG